MKKKLLLFLIVIAINSYAKDNAEILYKNGLITYEEYKLTKNNTYEIEGEYFYSLSINGELKSKIYEVSFKNNKAYFPVYEFFKLLKFKNFSEKNNIVIFKLGSELTEISINKNNSSMMIDNEFLDIKNKFFIKDNEIYLEESVFKKAFLNYLSINNNLQKINMTLSFSSPDELNLRMNVTEKLIKKERSYNELLFTNEKKMFELGYLKVNANEVFNKKVGEDFKKDWEANLEYQGSLFYGEFTTNYDLKTHSFKEARLRYDEVYTNHMFELANYEVNEHGSREWELSFRKDKGYYINGSKNYIIRENVPIGSRVELIYLGTVIDIENEKNGIVEFNRAEIKNDREYQLKIYTDDGKIIEKTINTTSNYNQQNKGEIEYDFSLREKHDIKKYDFYSNAYYGLTDNITVGMGYMRTPTYVNKKYVSLDRGKLETIYSSSIYSMPYTFKIDGEKTFNNLEYDITGKNTKDDYTLNYLGQIDINKFRLKAEQTNYGKYYDESKKQNFNIRYTPISSLDLEYEIEKTEKYKNLFEPEKSEKNQSFSVDYSKSYNDFLVTGEYKKYLENKDDENEYGLNIYYNGWRSITTRLENKWLNDGKDYEVALSIFNNGNNAIDYSFEARYSAEEKERLTFRFTLNLDNWFNFDSMIDKKGNQDYKIGIDRIVDLKNPTKKIESMNSSRVNVITFVDLNNNNIYDVGEEKVGKVEVSIGKQTITTNKNGEGMFYGIPNEIIYDLNPKIKKPNFLLGNNKIKIKGKTSSTITAYIPLKPMVTLTGIVNIDKSLNKNAMEKMMIYDELYVQIKDINGKVIDTAIPDNTGVFEISGLLPKQYFIEVQYTGLSYNIKGINEVIQLSYVEEDKDGNKIFFVFNEKEIKMKGEVKNG